MDDKKNDDLDDVSISMTDQDLGSNHTDIEDMSASHTGLQMKPSVISEGFEFTGEIRANGRLSVDGVISGKVTVNSLSIGSQGVLNGEVSAETVSVKGHYSGQMDCEDITIGGRSVVDANLSYSSIVVQRGGVLKGELHKK
jgi:cytoskeletal protein CcmA (bactofilin family)